jgi:hypothetical protein
MFKKISVIALALVLLFGMSKDALAVSTMTFAPSRVNVTAGQTFRVTVSVNPQGVRNYTVKAHIKYPSDILSLQTWKFADDWMPVRQDDSDTFDQANGVLVRTAGYPKGFNAPIQFGTATFVATKNGSGFVHFNPDGSLILDENSANVLGPTNDVTVTIESAAAAPAPTEQADTAPAPAATPAKPAPAPVATTSSLAVKFALEKDRVDDARSVLARTEVKMLKKGSMPTTLSYEVVDSHGQRVATKQYDVSVTDTYFVDSNLISADLPGGQYTVLLTVSHNGMNELFRQTFEVVKAPAPQAPASNNGLIVLLSICVLALAILTLFFLKKRGQDDETVEEVIDDERVVRTRRSKKHHEEKSSKE